MHSSFKYTVLIILLVCSRSFLQAQNNYYEALKAIRDSSYPLAEYHLNNIKSAEYDEPLIRLKLLTLRRLNNQDDMCQYLGIAKKLHYEDEFTKFYIGFHCLKNFDNFPEDLKELYKQKDLTKENGYSGRYTKEDTLRGSDNANRKCYDVFHYMLDIRFDVKAHTIKGTLQMDFVWKEKADTIQIDAHEQLKIDSVKLSGIAVPFIRMNNLIYISKTEKLMPGQFYSLTFYYHAKPKDAIEPPWQGGFVWKKNKGSVWAGVACEHLGSSFWWPGKDFAQDEPDSMSLNFEVEHPYKVISNGNLIAESVIPDNFHRFCWKVVNPINTYNATFYIGEYVKLEKGYTDIKGQSQKLRFYVMPYREKEALEYFSFSAEVLAFYEKAFGEYPFWKDGFAMVESPFKGMEHQSAIAIGDGFREKDDEENHYTYVKDDHLIIHETAHEWWGNSVTASDMADAWLQEGFATYSEYLFIENKYGSDIFIRELNMQRYYILNKWLLIGKKGVNDNTFIGSDIYHKGAFLLQNIRSSLSNDSLFFSILKGFASKNQHKIISTEDFINFLHLKSGKDFTALFHIYLHTLNTPTLEYSLKVSESGEKEFTFKWTKVPEGFQMPFSVKINKDRYKKIMGTTRNQTMVLSSGENFNFSGSPISYYGCPSHFYSHFNTKQIR